MITGEAMSNRCVEEALNVFDLRQMAKQRLPKWLFEFVCFILVGARGFEPPTTCTPCRYATRLRYAPKH